MENVVGTNRAWQGQFLGRGVALLPTTAAAAATGVSIARRDVDAAGRSFTQNTHKYMVPGPPRGRSC